jgi:protein required for attachment to host cells
MAKGPTIWIVVADSARARFFVPSEDAKKLVSLRSADLVAPQSRVRPRELKSDKPGRSYSSARGGVRHAFEPPHDYHKIEKHRFARTLADALDSACKNREFDAIILVAPRRSLGELRSLLSKRVQGRVRLEIARDLTTETPTGLWRRLAAKVRSVLLQAGAPRRAAPSAGAARVARP